jgi:hypothetical protein
MGNGKRVLAGAITTLGIVAQAGATPAPAGLAALSPDTPGAGSHLLVDAKGPEGGLRPKQLPVALGLAFAKGFTLNLAAVDGTCTAKQADAQACPEASRLGAGAIGVVATGPAFSPDGDRFLAKLSFFRADTPDGIVFSFREQESGFSGASIGKVSTIDRDGYGALIRWDALPLPELPPGFTFSIDHLQLDLGAGSQAAPVAAPKPKPKPKKKAKPKLRCVKYKGAKGHRRCVKYKRASTAHKSAAGSFIVNPAACTGSWAVQLQIAYKSGEEQREAAAPCTAPAR